MYIIPEGAYSHRINDRLAWGFAGYGNGGLNTEYRGNNGVAGSNAAPGVCGTKPANFVLGCDKFGLDIMQLVFAPGMAYEVAPGHAIGIAPLLQRFEAYGFQAFAPFSKQPSDLNSVTQRGRHRPPSGNRGSGMSKKLRLIASSLCPSVAGPDSNGSLVRSPSCGMFLRSLVPAVASFACSSG